ncbi:hypothetical protein FKM82_019632 [Ascaphus truei]
MFPPLSDLLRPHPDPLSCLVVRILPEGQHPRHVRGQRSEGRDEGAAIGDRAPNPGDSSVTPDPWPPRAPRVGFFRRVGYARLIQTHHAVCIRPDERQGLCASLPHSQRHWVTSWKLTTRYY